MSRPEHYFRDRYHALKDNGLCVRCQKPLDRVGCYCTACQQKEKQMGCVPDVARGKLSMEKLNVRYALITML